MSQISSATFIEYIEPRDWFCYFSAFQTQTHCIAAQVTFFFSHYSELDVINGVSAYLTSLICLNHLIRLKTYGWLAGYYGGVGE